MMPGPGKTPAEQQLEALRQLKQTQARRKPTPAPAPKAATPASVAPGVENFELTERPATPAKKRGPALTLSPQQWKRLRERQREHKEFRRRKDMGDWAAELLLALPAGVAGLSQAAKQELFRKMREWAEARGLR